MMTVSLSSVRFGDNVLIARGIRKRRRGGEEEESNRVPFRLRKLVVHLLLCCGCVFSIVVMGAMEVAKDPSRPS